MSPSRADTEEQGTARIRPRARLMRTLGDELISSERVALVELVKNAYDADATRVLIRFLGPLTGGEGTVEVIDDGHGMSLSTMKGAFLEPATGFRRQDGSSRELQRAVTGEKGIGRFAVSRLADELEVISREPDAASETRMLFDWRRFDDPQAFLDEIDVVWDADEPEEIAPGGVTEHLWPGGPPSADRVRRGTVLRMGRLRADWDRDELLALRTDLSRLVSPFLFEQRIDNPGRFEIHLELPSKFRDLAGPVEPPEALRSPQYVMVAHVQPDGQFTTRLKLGDLPTETEGGCIRLGDRLPSCGPFELQLRVWDRDSAAMRRLGEQANVTAGQVREDLDAAAGVSVYRDGFRVLPYGESGDDWLGLDARRVNNPTLRLSNNQVVGFVLIGKDHNPQLRDQTNREGLLQGRAYDDLRRSVKQVITHLEDARYRLRRHPETTERHGRRQERLFSGLDLSAIQEHAAQRYPQDRQLIALIDRTTSQIAEDIDRAHRVISRFRRLATLGQLIDQVLHDGRAPLAKIGDEATLGRRAIHRDVDRGADLAAQLDGRLERIATQHDVLATVLRRIEPFGGRRRGRPKKITVEEALRDATDVLSSEIERLQVDVRLPAGATEVTVDAAELQEVVVNLLQNSLHWLQEVPAADRAIAMTVARDEGVRIVVSDSGPGVPEQVRDLIFDPYFTTKPDGVGLGLAIAGEIVAEYYDGQLSLLADGPLPGATFEIVLRRRV